MLLLQLLKESAKLVLFLPTIPEIREKVHVYPCHDNDDIKGYTFFGLFFTWFPSDHSTLKGNILKSYKNLKQQQKGIVFEIDLMIIRKQCIVFIRLRGRNSCPFLNWLQIYNVALNTINLLQNIQQPLSLLEAGNTW